MRRATLAAALSLALACGCSLMHPLEGFAGPDDVVIPADATSPPVVPPPRTDVDAGVDGEAQKVPEVDTHPDAGPDVDAPPPAPAHYLYVLGGSNAVDGASVTSDLFQDDVFYAPIFADGSLGAWDVTLPMDRGVRNHAAVVHGDDVYVIGGEYAGGKLSADVHVAKMLPSGKVDGWRNVANVLPSPRKDHAVSVYGDHLYVSGGYDGKAEIRTVSHGLLAPGAIGAVTDTGALAAGTRTHASAAVNGCLFAIGGTTATSYVQDVFGLAIGDGGQLGLAARKTSLNLPLAYHRAAVDGATVYVVGGISEGGRLETSSVYSATVQRDGSLASWAPLAGFSGARWRHAAVAAFGYVYLVGGRQGDEGAFLDDVQIARILPDRSLEWRASKALPKRIASHALVVH